MPASTVHRLPGITYEVVPPPLTDTLPRMDVAGFVGFASAGPVDVPVLVDDIAGFREVFGPDVALARDPDDGRIHAAHLGPVVEAFLRNGGRRCWVVRVAGEEAGTTTFPAAGLVGIPASGGPWRAAELRARSVGAAFDDSSVGTALATSRLPAVVEVAADDRTLWLAGHAQLTAGDLVRATSHGGARTVLLAVADAVPERGRLRVTWDRTVTLVSDLAAGDVSGTATLLSDGSTLTTTASAAVADDGTGRPLPGHLELDLGSGDPPPVGSLVRIDPDGVPSVIAPIRGPAVGSGGRVLAGPCHAVAEEAAPLADDARPLLERLTLTLAVHRGERLQARIEGLGFDPRHPDHWGQLPDDEQLFARRGRAAGTDGRGPRPVDDPAVRLPELWSRAASPRFPLAGVPDGANAFDGAGSVGGDSAADVVWFPVAVPDVVAPAHALAATSDTASASRRTRAGLASFDAESFLDPDLRDTSGSALLDRAGARAHTAQPRRLRGIHALLPIDEVTIVAVPDAGHPEWVEVVDRPAPPPDAPQLASPRRRGDELELWWSPVAEVDRYVLEEGLDPELHDALVRLDGPAPLGPAGEAGPGEVSPGDVNAGSIGVPVPGASSCPGGRVFRVRAIDRDGRSSPWSNTVQTVDPPTAFQACGTALPAPDLAFEPDVDTDDETDADPDGSARGGTLHWTPASDVEPIGEVGVELQRSHDPLFEDATSELPGDTVGERRAEAPDDGHAFHRARYVHRADPPRPGPWSITIVLPAPARRSVELRRPPAGELLEHLLTVQRAVLRMAAARGDLLALLSLPAHYREPETVAHVSWLRGEPTELDPTGPADLALLGADESGAFEHGAVFAPWLATRTSTGVRLMPPDGAVAGVVARRTIERGAWISPANQPLVGVIALGRELDTTDRATVAAAGINLIVRRPTGFVADGAVTLGRDRATQPIEVRRLLALLRRIVLRHGATYVFEPHGHRFQAMVRRTFEGVLADLYERGAFAGAVPSEGYRVVADRTVNPPGALDAGRFVVELSIAPTQPMAFIRVRLVQTGPGEALAVEVRP